jgi:hypothetical protein
LRDGIHLIDHAGKIYHSITPTAGSVSPMVSSLVSDTVLEATRTLVAAALGRSSLHGSLRLFVQSLEPDNDRLRSFLAAWNSIEIFVNKTFADYEAALMAKIKEGGDSPGLDRYLSRIVEVMKPRYRLADKFALLAHSLDSNAVETDLQDFTEIKAIRDRLIHGEDIPDSELPLHKAQELLRRYLEIHLLSEGA